MKKIMIVVVTILTCIVLGSMSFCNSNELEIYMGDTIDLRNYINASEFNFYFDDKTVVQNLNASILSVNSSYEIIPKAVGKGLLILSSDGRSLTLNISVLSPVESILMSDEYVSLLLGEIYGLDYDIKLKTGATHAKDVSLIWRSIKPNVATVVNGSKIVTRNVGSTTLIAELENGEQIAEIDVTVLGHSNKLRISNDSSKRAMNVGDDIDLKAYLGTKDVTESVEWTTLTPHILKIKSSGLITAIGEGRGEIEARTSTGMKITYEVNAYSMIDRVELNRTKLDFKGIGQTYQLLFNVYPKNKDFPPILSGYHYTTSNPDIVTVSDSGLVTAQGPGIAIVTVVFDDSQKKAICTIEVASDQQILASNYIPVERIILSPYIGTALVGEKILLEYNIFPVNATDQSVTFDILHGDDSQIKEIDGSYYFIPKKRGNIQIVINSADDGKSQISIPVTSPIKSLDMSLDTRHIVGSNSEVLYLGETAKILTRVYAREGYNEDDVYNSSLIYKASDPTVAKVIYKENAYFVQGLKQGTTELTITNSEGLHEAKLWLTIEDPLLSISTDDYVTLPIGNYFRPRVLSNIRESIKNLGADYDINSMVRYDIQEIYLHNDFIEQELAFEKEMISSFGNSPYTQQELDLLKTHENRLILLEAYNNRSIDGYSRIDNINELKDRNGRKYNFYTISSQYIKSNYPIKMLVEISINNLPYKTETVMTWQNNDLLEIKRGSKDYNLDDLMVQYGLETSLEGADNKEKVSLLITYMNHVELFQELPSYTTLSAVDNIVKDQFLFKAIRELNEEMTKSDLLILAECLHEKYVDRVTKFDINNEQYYYDVVDMNLLKIISLNYVKPDSATYFGVDAPVSKVMIYELINDILGQNYFNGTSSNKSRMTFADLATILNELMD